jgi:hypothetical protein
MNECDDPVSGFETKKKEQPPKRTRTKFKNVRGVIARAGLQISN